MHRVKLNNKIYITALDWLPTDGMGRRELGEKIKAEGLPYTHFLTAGDMFGLASDLTGRNYSLATVPMDNDDCVIVAHLIDEDEGDFFWVNAIIKHLPSALGDRDFTTQQEAVATAEYIAQLHNISVVYMEQEELAEIPNTGLRLVAITQILTAKNIKMAASIAALCGVVYFAYYTYDKVSTSHRLKIEEARRADVASHPERYFDLKWKGQCMPHDFMLRSIASILDLSVVENAWVLERCESDGQTVNAVWKASEYVDVDVPPDKARMNMGRTHANRGINLPTPTAIVTWDIPNLLPMDTARWKLLKLARFFKIETELEFKERDTTTVDDVNLECPYVVGEWKMSLPSYLINDYKAFADLVDIPGLLIKSISYDREQQWIMKGELYAR